METQILSFYPTPVGTRFITLFGYSSKGVPGLEINGLGKYGKNLKEKIIYLNRIRKIKTPIRRIVISLDANELDPNAGAAQLRWLELPALLVFWHLIGAIKVASLEDCICSGEVKVGGEIVHLSPPSDLFEKMPESEEGHKIIQARPCSKLWHMDSKLFLGHIPNLQFKTYMERVSETPIKSIIA